MTTCDGFINVTEMKGEKTVPVTSRLRIMIRNEDFATNVHHDGLTEKLFNTIVIPSILYIYVARTVAPWSWRDVVSFHSVLTVYG